MPITILPVGPGLTIGPGLSVQWSSDFTGIVPPDMTLHLHIADNDNNVNAFYNLQTPTQFLVGSVPILSRQPQVETGISANIPAGTQTFVQAVLSSGSSTLDQGTSAPIPWDPTTGLGEQAWLLSFVSGKAGGLTDAQAQQLTNVEAATSPVSLIDNLTLQEISPGPTGNPINVSLPEAFWGVIIRIVTVPDGVTPITPDGDYFSMTLATVRIYRANDLWMRVPVHTGSKIIPIYNEHIAAAVALVLTSQWLLNMHLEIDWAPGVTGHAFLMRFP